MFSTASYICKCTVIDVGPAGEFVHMVSGVVGSSLRLVWLMMSECQGWQLRLCKPLAFHQACSDWGLWIKYEREIYEGSADKVLDPPALQLCHMPLTEWLMLIHCRMTVYLYWSGTDCAHRRITVMSVVIPSEGVRVFVSFCVYVSKYSVMSCGKGCQIQRLSSEQCLSLPRDTVTVCASPNCTTYSCPSWDRDDTSLTT